MSHSSCFIQLNLIKYEYKPRDSMWSSARRCAVAYCSYGVEGEVTSSVCEPAPFRSPSNSFPAAVPLSRI
ncbi:hypothetical protein J6590_098759 [Homalodisca vitripennis]|nr:hypothetical protein J6590_098759 [Homalodisca vitripennis]